MTSAVSNPITHKLDYGMNINPASAAGRPAQATTLKGLKWVRFVFQMDAAGRTLDQAFAFYDLLVMQYNHENIGVLLILNQETFWGNGPWQNNGDWDVYAHNFAALGLKIVQHYHNATIGCEIWNEQDNHGEASVYVPPKAYAHLAKQFTDTIGPHPGVPILMGGLASGTEGAIAYIRDVQHELGAAFPFDALAIHPYGMYTGKVQPALHTGWFGSLSTMLDRLIQNFPKATFWITEIGVSQPGMIHKEDWGEVAQYMRGVFDLVELHYGKSVPVVIWFAWSDAMREAGIVDNASAPKEPIYSCFFQYVRSTPTDELILTPQQPLHIRQSPSAGNNVPVLAVAKPGERLIATQPADEVLPKLGVKGQWVQVRYFDTEQVVSGYCAAWFLERVS